MTLMAEAPLALVAGSAYLLLIEHLRTSRGATLILTASLAALAAYVKPVAYGFFLIAAIVAGLWTRRWRTSFVATLLGGALIGAWHARNVSVAGYPGFSTQIAQFNRSGEFQAWRAQNTHLSRDEVRAEAARRRIQNPTSTEALRFEGGSITVRVIAHFRGVWRTVSNPGVVTWLQFLGLEPRGMAATTDLVRAGPFGFLIDSVVQRPAVVVGTTLLGGWCLGLWVLFTRGLFRARSKEPAVVLASIATVLYFALLSGGSWGQSRFRAPFTAALCLVAAFALDARRPPRDQVAR
jgi:hypothetical protein